MAWWKKGCLTVVLGLVLLVLAFWLVYGGAKEQLDGEIARVALAPEHVAARVAGQKRAAPNETNRILFGDLHVHTTLSVDAFMWGLPLMGGEGVHPPADACDFARFCSQLDFYALTDHAEALNPRTWQMTRDSVRQCNSVVAGSEQPDTIAFTGYEWTQVALTPEEHYGHKNVVFKYDSDDELPARPISAPGLATRAFSKLSALWPLLAIPARSFPNQQGYLDFARHIRENAQYPFCPDGVNSKDLPASCRERAANPAVLFQKLNEWGLDTLVIPHGTTWGFYTPLGYTWDKQLRADLDDTNLQRLVEVFSGHGNSEEYRDFRSAIVTEDGLACPEPTEGYEPCCWRAGEIIRERCEDPGSDACQQRVEKARADFLRVSLAGHVTLPGEDVPDWNNCGQCTDCYLPAYQYRPGGSVQYMLGEGRLRGPGSAAARDDGLHRLERQSHRASGHRVQGVRATSNDRGARCAERVLARVDVWRSGSARAGVGLVHARRLDGAAALRADVDGAAGFVFHHRRARGGTRDRTDARSDLGRHADAQRLRHLG